MTIVEHLRFAELALERATPLATWAALEHIRRAMRQFEAGERPPLRLVSYRPEPIVQPPPVP